MRLGKAIAAAIAEHAALSDAHHAKGISNLKVKQETRDMTAASGDVAYTGYGFMPTCLIVLGYRETENLSWGFADSDKAGKCIYSCNTTGKDDYLVVLTPSTDDFQKAIVKSYDVDGFTLTWTKVVAPPAGTAYLQILALR